MKWEYTVAKVFASDLTLPGSINALNELGAQGWEAVSSWSDYNKGSFVLLKRQKGK